MVSSQYFLLVVLMACSAVYCHKQMQKMLCQTLTPDVVTALGKCWDLRPPGMVAETENCMKSLNQTTINDASVRQTMCDKTLGHQLMKCIRKSHKQSKENGALPPPPNGTGAPPSNGSGAPPPNGSGAPPGNGYMKCVKDAMALLQNKA